MSWVVALLIAVVDWPMFGFDSQHTNHAAVSFEALPRLAWTFQPERHLWTYARRTSVWSSSAVAAPLGDGGALRLFIGSYDRNLYCLDAETGQELWRFTTGGAINSSPVLYRAGGRLLLAAASTDRMLYGLEAATGTPLWTDEIYPWTFTAFDAITSSPAVFEQDGRPRLAVGIWYADRRPFKHVQRGELLCVDGASGAIVWRRTLSPSALFSPAVGMVQGKTVLFVTGADGRLFCLSAEDGRLLWTYTSAIPISSSPLVSDIGERPVVVFGTVYGLVDCVDAASGRVLWRYKAGMQISSAGAVGEIDGTRVVMVPSYDRCLYCLELSSGRLRWRHETRQHLPASPVLLTLQGKPCVIVGSMDNHLYALEASTGARLWSAPLGKRVWLYEARGETLWPSPIAVASSARPLLLVPWYDGTLYAFSDRGPASR